MGVSSPCGRRAAWPSHVLLLLLLLLLLPVHACCLSQGRKPLTRLCRAQATPHELDKSAEGRTLFKDVAGCDEAKVRASRAAVGKHRRAPAQRAYTPFSICTGPCAPQVLVMASCTKARSASKQLCCAVLHCAALSAPGPACVAAHHAACARCAGKVWGGVGL